jgi:hypothetical protein
MSSCCARTGITEKQNIIAVIPKPICNILRITLSFLLETFIRVFVIVTSPFRSVTLGDFGAQPRGIPLLLK